MNILVAKCWVLLFKMLTALLQRQVTLDLLSVENEKMTPNEFAASERFSRKIAELEHDSDEVINDIKLHFGF